ncbi:MAG: FHA domain-containing protein [Deltaproteobacteria bacterium]|nr:FHA domain-containing protein [Deltaproteobacteria bacterium]
MEPVEIVIRRTGQPDRTARFGEGTVRVGRGDDNEIVLSDVSVSRKHAQIKISRAEVVVQDLGSGNGCYHDGKKFEARPVKHGDEVVIDPFVLEFRMRKTASAAPPPPAVKAGARLEVLVGAGMAGSSYPIPTRGLTIGRSEDRDVVIPDPAASRHHCSVLNQNGEYMLRDMGSANGVFVGQNRVRDHVLQDGEVLRIGNTEMRFVRGEANGESTTQFGASAAVHSAPNPTRTTTFVRETQKRGRSTLVLVVIALLVLAALGLLALGGIGTIGAVLAYRLGGTKIPWPSPTRPAWVVQLPAGLSETATAELFDAGVGKMQAGDNEGALLDFYRVLTADPGNSAAEKFAYAAGEHLVIDTLEKPLPAAVGKTSARATERDALIASAKAGNRDAEARLQHAWRDDAVAMQAMGWPLSPAGEKMAATAQDAASLQSRAEYGAAAARWTEVLKGSSDPVLVMTADAGRLACRRELARQIAVAWADAVRADAFGEPNANALLVGVAKAWPENPSTQLRLNSR